jgi:hypothetical protein
MTNLEPMMRFMRLGSFALLCILVACATTENASQTKATVSRYSAQERSVMTYCLGLSDVANVAAKEKLKGTSASEIKKRYEKTGRMAQTAYAAIDKVYADQVPDAWAYTVGFFKECASEVGQIVSERSGPASHCLQNQMIADVAFNYKTSGAPKEAAHRYFAPLPGDEPRRIVELVYGTDKQRAVIRTGIWEDCMRDL